MKDKKFEAIKLLNDGKNTKKEGACNSWPNTDFYKMLADPMICEP